MTETKISRRQLSDELCKELDEYSNRLKQIESTLGIDEEPRRKDNDPVAELDEYLSGAYNWDTGAEIAGDVIKAGKLRRLIGTILANLQQLNKNTSS